MATIKKYSDGTVFYDAFGGKIGETTIEEEWMGDSFNRDSICAAYQANEDDCLNRINTLTECATATVTANANNCYALGLASHADGFDTIVKDVKGTYGTYDQKLVVNDIAFSTTAHSLKAELQELKAQIDALKKSMTATSKLRPALKTLQYKREVE